MPTAAESGPSKYQKAFTPGTTRKRFEQQLHVEKEYGEHTWSPQQTTRDLMQNHFDAQTERCVMQLIRRVLVEPVPQIDTFAPAVVDALKKLGLELYRYQTYAKKGGENAFDGLVRDIAYTLQRIPRPPLRPDLPDAKRVLAEVADIHEVPPQIDFFVLDSNNPSAPPQRVSREELQSEQYSEERSKVSPKWGTKFRYVVAGFKIQDQGSGFDPKLATLFAPTKQGKPYTRGQYGEGLKMSYMDLMRRQAQIKLRSAYVEHTDETAKQHVWQGRPSMSEKGDILFSGAELEFEPNVSEQENTGSYTIVDMRTMPPAAYKQLAQSVDCRLPAFTKSFLDFSPAREQFIYSVLHNGSPAGVNVQQSPDEKPAVYVQGFLVEENPTLSFDYGGKLAFSYDFADKSLIGGRDRKTISTSMAERVQELWTRIKDPALMRVFVRQCFFAKGNSLEQSTTAHHCVDAETPLATRRIFLDALMTELKLTSSPAVVVMPQQQEREKKIIDRAQSRGVSLVHVENYPRHFEIITNALRAYNGFSLFTLYQLAQQPDFVDKASQKTEKQLEYERKFHKPYKEAVRQLQKLCRDADIAFTADSITELRIDDRGADKNHYTNTVLEYDHEKKQFYVLVRPSSSAHYDKTTFQHSVMALLLATVGRNHEFATDPEVMQVAQNTAQRAIDNALTRNLSEMAAVPQRFNETRWSTKEDLERANPMQAALEAAPKQLEDWELMQKAAQLLLTFEECADIAYRLRYMQEPYLGETKRILEKRCITHGDEVGYFTYDGPNCVFIKKQIAELEKIEQLKNAGVIVYILDGERSFIPFSMEPGTTVAMSDPHSLLKIYRDGDALYSVSHENCVQAYGYNNMFPAVNNGSLLYHTSPDRAKRIPAMYKKEVSVSSQFTEVDRTMHAPTGTIETSLTTEYGTDNWDNPVRLLEDIVQNHLDASRERRVYMTYEVRRGNERIWVEERDVVEQDRIVGIRFADRGTGYAPERLQKLGDTKKTGNPFVAGKYGEGTKLLAASAVRNGVELTFSSIGLQQDRSVRWRATAGSKPVDIVIDGRSQQRKQVVFDYNSGPNHTPYTSETILRFPEGNTTDAQEFFWRDIENTCHPARKTGERHHGLTRYIRQLRTEESGVVDLGFMKILLDEPGVVYDNGLRVDACRGDMVCGYDFFDITDTRERQHVDEKKLQKYIQEALRSCRDPRFFDRVIAKMERAVSSGYLQVAHEKEFDFPQGNLYALPLMNQAVAQHTRDKIFHSSEWMQAREPEQAAGVEHFVQFLPPGQRRNVSKEVMDKIYRIFPTSLNFATQFSSVEVPQYSETIVQLAGVVEAAARVQLGVLKQMDRKHSNTPLTEKILSRREYGYGVTPKEALSVAWLRTWEQWKVDEIRRNRKRVFVAPSAVGYHGLMTSGQKAPEMGINEALLKPGRARELVGTIHHELAHFVTAQGDHEPKFIHYLLLLAADARKRSTQTESA